MKEKATRKGHTSFLLFHFWDLKLVATDSALNSVLGTQLNFFKNVGIATRKAAKFENPVNFFSEMSFAIYSCKTGKLSNQNVLTNSQNFVKF